MDEFASREYPIREDMRFQDRFWRWERVAWLILILLAAVGLSGALGAGPLSWLGEMTAFDFVLFLIIGGSTQRAITGED